METRTKTAPTPEPGSQDSESPRRNFVAIFMNLDDDKYTTIANVVEALGQHTCNSDFLDIDDVSEEDLHVLWGLAYHSGRFERSDIEGPESVVEESAWAAARYVVDRITDRSKWAPLTAPSASQFAPAKS